MSTKVSPGRIVTDHWNTLYDHQTGKLSVLDIAVAAGIPVVITAVLAALGFTLKNAGEVLGGLAILTGFVFGLLVYVFELRLDAAKDPRIETGAELHELLNELFVNVAYTALIGIVTVVMIIAPLGLGLESEAGLNRWASALVTLFGAHFFVSLLQCLKRTHLAFTRYAAS